MNACQGSPCNCHTIVQQLAHSSSIKIPVYLPFLWADVALHCLAQEEESMQFQDPAPVGKCKLTMEKPSALPALYISNLSKAMACSNRLKPGGFSL